MEMRDQSKDKRAVALSVINNKLPYINMNDPIVGNRIMTGGWSMAGYRHNIFDRLQQTVCVKK